MSMSINDSWMEQIKWLPTEKRWNKVKIFCVSMISNIYELRLRQVSSSFFSLSRYFDGTFSFRSYIVHFDGIQFCAYVCIFNIFWLVWIGYQIDRVYLRSLFQPNNNILWFLWKKFQLNFNINHSPRKFAELNQNGIFSTHPSTGRNMTKRKSFHLVKSVDCILKCISTPIVQFKST